MSVQITDVWPVRGDAFFKVQGVSAMNIYPYENASERAGQLERARRVAAFHAQAEFSDVIDLSGTPQEPTPSMPARRRRP